MQFIDYLPEGLIDLEWQVNAPPGGVGSRLRAVAEEGELFIDLSIRRDGYIALLRVIPDRVQGVEQDDTRHMVYHPNNDVTAFFLDIDGVMTDNLVRLAVALNTEVTQPDMSAGWVKMWPGSNDVSDLIVT